MKSIVDVECNFSRKCLIVLRKVDTCSCKKTACKSAKTAGKDSGCESGGLYCVYRLKDNGIQTESWSNHVF